MIGALGDLVLGLLLDLAAALLQFLVRMAQWALIPLRFVCSRRFRAEWREARRDRPSYQWLRLLAGGASLAVLVLSVIWGVQLATAERQEVHVDRHVRTEMVLGSWALGVMRRVYRERVDRASGP